MPYAIRRKSNRYEVVNVDTGEIHARSTSKAKAEKQLRLLKGIERGWQPTDKPGTFTRNINGKRVNLHVRGGASSGKTQRG